jgi:membrane protease YdiL (CAAX protease family)
VSEAGLPSECAGCGAAFRVDAAFCARCGQPRVPPVAPPPLPTGGDVRFVLRFYAALLVVQLVSLIYAQATDRVFPTVVGATIALALVTLVAAIPHRALVLPAYRGLGFGPRGFALILMLAPIVLGLVCGYVYGMGRFFGVHVPGELEGFDTHGLAPAVLLIVIAPPLIEELGFRGLIYGALRRHMTLTETFLISSFAFALLHLSVPALLTHFPLGLYLCWLRHRSDSLWPPMFAHGLHNLGVVLVELYGAT